MNRKTTATLIVAVALAGAVSGCGAQNDGGDTAANDSAAGVAASGVADGGDAAGANRAAPLDPATEAQLRASLDMRLTEVETSLGRLPGLIASIRQDMRRHLNAAHVSAAQRNGVGPVRDSAHFDALVQSGQLVRLPDSTQWWVLRELDRSLPYVTPGTKAALEDLGRRFHVRLDEHGLPPFRLDITSVLRTGQQQAELRRRNSNAASTTSSHQFGTTLDIAYLSFAAPAEVGHAALLGPDAPAGRLSEPLRAQLMTQLDTLAVRYAPHIEGELGAVLQQLQRDGAVLPLRERSQPVFHITVAK